MTDNNNKPFKTTNEERIKELGWLIGFIDCFANKADYDKLLLYVRHTLLFIASDPQELKELEEFVYTSGVIERLENENIIDQYGEKESEIERPHTGYKILKDVLADLKEKNRQELEILKEDLDSIAYRKPQDFYYLVSKPLKYLFDGETDFSSGQSIRVSPKNAKNEVIVNVKSYVYMNNKILPSYLTRFDKSVLFSICTLYENGNTYFTTKNIYELIYGKRGAKAATLEKIDNSINKMRSTILEFPIYEWLKFKHKNPDNYASEFIDFNDNLLSLKAISYLENGKKVYGYVFKDNIFLLECARALNELFPVPTKIRNLPIRTNDSTTAIRDYLIERIEGMKNPRNSLKSNIIKFSSIYPLSGSESKTQNKRTRETVFNILNYWASEPLINTLENKKNLEPWEQLRLDLYNDNMDIEPLDYIKSYKVIKDNRGNFHGIEIIL